MTDQQLPDIDRSFTTRLDQVFTSVADPESPWNEKHKGDWFEQAVVKVLNSEDGRKLYGLEWAVLWEDWNGKSEEVILPDGTRTRKYPDQDLGIDIVAKLRTGKMMAVQAKARGADAKILKEDLSDILAYATPEDWDKVLFVHTGKNLSPPAKKLIEQHGDRLQILNRMQFARYCDDWRMEFPVLGEKWPRVIASNPVKYELRPHQQRAVNDVLEGFISADRGKLIMPCGAGKTFTSQKIAETLVGNGGAVLVVLPSISLLSQSMREWSAQQNGVKHRYLGVCSDSKAGKTIDDEFMQTIQELDVPVTTNPIPLATAMGSKTPDEMLVVFTTYQSLGKVHEAQQDSGLPFGLALLDEAHRTTGIAELGATKKQKETMRRELSAFRRVHDPNWLKIERRLYMTATPKIYTDPTSQKELTADGDNVYSMSDETIYGKTLHELTFAEAVRQDLLAPYSVVLVGVRDEAEAEKLHDHIMAVRTSEEGKQVDIDGELAAKILGSTKFAANYSSDKEDAPRPGEGTLKKILVFTNSIKSSKAAQVGFDYGDDMLAGLDEDWEAHGIDVEARHVDGTMAADERDRLLDWLRKSVDPNRCRVLTNAKCLTEGIDVPALDGCVFLEGRKSKVDVVQAVGRIMRKAEGKERGWITLPVLTSIPEHMTDADLLEQQKYISKQWKPAWDVLRALAAHDEEFRLEIAATAAGLAAGQKPRKGSGKVSFEGTLNPEANRDFDSAERELANRLWAEDWEKVSSLIYPVIVTQLGGTKDLNRAGVQAGKLIDKVRTEIRSIKRGENEQAKAALENYWEGMKNATSSDILTKDDVDTMLSQHIVMEPVFSAFFGQGKFRSGNPVSQVLDSLLKELQNSGFDLASESREELAGFYEQVNRTVAKMETPAEFQGYLKEVYNAFFLTAFKETADKLGIAYTPIEIVDFINRSADWVSRQTFGKGVGDKDVGVMDPFTGTGTFIARMLADPELISDSQLDHKYAHELFAYEVVLLAYYIASVNIEHAYHSRKGSDGRNVSIPFEGIVLHDTFAGFGMQGKIAGLDGNSRRARAIEAKDVEIVVSNPPYSGGQKSASDDNENIEYDLIKDKIRDEVVSLISGSVTNVGMLYNLYVHSLVWAEHRLDGKGVMSFVMPADWMRTKAGEGLRRWVEQKFSKAWIVDLAGNCRTSGEERKREAGSVFPGGETTSPIGVFVFVKDPAKTGKCEILYRRVKDYMKGREKREWLETLGSIEAVEGWERLETDKHGEWFGSRDPRFETWIPVASKSCKAGKDDNAIFRMHSLGLSTGRDYLAFNSDYDTQCVVAENAVNFYEETRASGVPPDVTKNLHIFKWGRRALDVLGQHGGKGAPANFEPELNIRPVLYRPFFPQWAHWEHKFNAMHYQLETMFPTGSAALTQREALPVDQGTLGTQIQRDALPVDNDVLSGENSRPTDLSITGAPPPRLSPNFQALSTTASAQQQHQSQPTTTSSSDKPHSSPDSLSEHWIPYQRHSRMLASNNHNREPRSLWPHLSSTEVGLSVRQHQGASSAQLSISWSTLNQNTLAVLGMVDNNFHGAALGGTSLLPRYTYRPNTQGGVFDGTTETPEGYERVDNITDTALNLFQTHYGDTDIDRDAIFFYVYGILHHPQYLEDHKDSLEAELPRIPLAPDFKQIRDIGYDLFKLHTSWTELDGHPLQQKTSPVFDANNPEHFKFTNIKYAGKKNDPDKSELVINKHLALTGIPEEAHTYTLNGLSPLDWIVKQYVVRQDYVDPETGKIKTSRTGDILPDVDGIVNDPNELFADNPSRLITFIEQVVQLSLQTAERVSQLADLEYDSEDVS